MREENLLYIKDCKNGSQSVYLNGDIDNNLYKSIKEVKKSCYRFGRDFNENRKFVSKLLHQRQKIPVLLDVKEEVILFPLRGLSCDENIWIQYGNVTKIKTIDGCRCCIVFVDGTILIVDCEKRSIQRQRKHCRELLQLLKTN